MGEPDEKIIEKIRKLLALATSSNENEAALAAAKAQDLLLRYNLERSQIDAAIHGKPDPFVTEYENDPAKSEWKIQLAFVIAKANLCKIIINYDGKLVWMGKQSNVEVARFLSNSIMADLERIATEKWAFVIAIRKLLEAHPELNDNDNFMGLGWAQRHELLNIHGKTWKNSFYLGAVEGIRVRLTQNLQQLQAASPNMNALVISSGHELAVYVHSVFPSLTTRGASTGTIAGGAYSMGRSTGATMGFKNGVGAGGSAAPRRIGG